MSLSFKVSANGVTVASALGVDIGFGRLGEFVGGACTPSEQVEFLVAFLLELEGHAGRLLLLADALARVDEHDEAYEPEEVDAIKHALEVLYESVG